MNKLSTNIVSISPVTSFHRNINKNFALSIKVVAKLDSSATKHFLTKQDRKKLNKKNTAISTKCCAPKQRNCAIKQSGNTTT